MFKSASIYYNVALESDEELLSTIEYPFCLDVEQVLHNAINEIRKEIDLSKIDKIKIVLKKHDIQGLEEN